LLQVIALASIAAIVLSAAAVSLSGQPQTSAAPAPGQSGSGLEVPPAGGAPSELSAHLPASFSHLPATISHLPASREADAANAGAPPGPGSSLSTTFNLIVTVPVIVGGQQQSEPEVLNGTVVVPEQQWSQPNALSDPERRGAPQIACHAARPELPMHAASPQALALPASSSGARAAIDLVA
jgi:hypothetical protein